MVDDVCRGGSKKIKGRFAEKIPEKNTGNKTYSNISFTCL